MTISEEREKTHMKCYKCKREVPDDAKFCPKCGSPQEFTGELIDRAINSDQAAITQLYNMTKDNVYYTIKTMISDEDMAQDLTQDTFLKAMKNLGQLNEPAAFRGWIKKIARNMTIDILRKRKVISFSQMVSADSDEAIEFEDDRPENLPEVVIDRRETTRLIGEILGTLSAEQRVVTELFYYEGFSVKEIAEELGVSENTVKSRLKYARNKIEAGVKELEKKGTKLYSLAPIPFLLLLLRSQEVYAAELPDADMLLQSMQSGNAFTGVEDGFLGQSADNGNVGGGTAKTAAEATKTGAGAVSKGIATKVIAGIVATSLIGGMIAGIANENNTEERPQEVRMEEQQETSPVEEQTEMKTERENDMEEETDNETEKNIQTLSELSAENRRIVEDALNDKFQEAIDNRIDFIDEEAIEYSITSENASFDNFTINSNMSRVSRYSGDLYVPFSVDINDWKNYWDNTDFNEEMYTKSYQNVTGYFLVHGLEVMSNGVLSEYSIDISSLYQDEKEMQKLFLEE